MSVAVAPGVEPPGLAARRIAAEIVEGVLHRRRPLDEQLEDCEAACRALPARDRALVRALASMVLRRLGTLRELLASLLPRGVPRQAPRVEAALLIGAAQILWLNVPAHAAVDLAVELVHADRHAARYGGLINAVLRRIAREGPQCIAHINSLSADTPSWLMARWSKSYGEDAAQAIADAHSREPPLDFTAKRDRELWADRLCGILLPTGSIRISGHGPIFELPGYAEGAWWVQDAAAALPAQLFRDVRDRRVADLCAAPGGKTCQLAAVGAKVTAVDRAAERLERLRQNLARLDLPADVIHADVLQWSAEPFDAVLLDAPCSATGTIRRHPDIPWLKREADIPALADLQRRLLARAAELTRSGGQLVYCVCSLEPEEGIEAIRRFVAERPDFHRQPIAGEEVGGIAEWLTSDGDLRTLPCHFAERGGVDGFYVARLQRS